MSAKLEAMKQKLRERRDRDGSVPRLTDDQARKIKQAFSDHPEWDDVYLFWDGAVRGGEEYRRSMTSRTAQLVAIASTGFPACVSRGHSQIRMESRVK